MTESPGIASNSNNTDTNSIGSFELVNNTPTEIGSFSVGDIQTPPTNSPINSSSNGTTNTEQDGFDTPLHTERSIDSVDVNNPTTPNPDNNNKDNNSTTTNGTNSHNGDQMNVDQQQQQQQQTHSQPEQQDVVLEPVELEPELTSQEIQELKSKVVRTSLVIGEKWCPVNAIWYHKWAQNYYTRDDLGPIDNSVLLQADGETMRAGLIESNHYILVPEIIYKKLKAVYGGGPDIYRKVIKGTFASNNVDMKIPFPLQFVRSTDLTKVIDGYALKSESIASLKDRYCKVFGLVPSEVKIWDFYKNNKHAELKPLEYVSNSNLLDNQLILLEEKNADGSWPADQRQSYYNSYYNHNQRTGAPKPGITGLTNLGNTCFMNSALQCLSNSYPISKYFINNKFEDDLNKTNPLGCNGELAQEYANLIKQIWKGDHTSVAPRGFKEQIEKFAPQFAGYHQHDSQELLAFLLDGLHEDLNKVKKKPFIESKDYDGRPDQVIAKEHWEMHRSRNDSVIVDWFQSQLKSKLVCPECGKISITFDPFMYLSLPLPTNSKRLFNILVIKLDSTTSIVEAVVSMGAFSEVMAIVSRETTIPLENMVFATTSNASISKIIKPETAVDLINLRDLVVAYEIQTKDPENPEVTFQQLKVQMKQTAANYYSTALRYPLILSVPSTVDSMESLYECILNRIKPALKNEDEIRQIFEQNQEQYQQQQQQKKEQEEEERKEKMTVDGDNHQHGNSADHDDEAPHGPYGHHVHNHRGMSYGSGGYDRERDFQMRFNSIGTYPSSSYFSGSRYGQSPQLPTDPRLIFQIYENVKSSHGYLGSSQAQAVSFPIKASELVLLWEENFEKYLDPDYCSPFQKSPHHRDIPSEQDITLEQCIELFTTEEKLGEQDPWYCNQCKKHQRATKKFDIWSAPPILVVHLKRFSYKRTLRDKLDIVVKFPLKDLDLSPFVLNKDQPSPVYDLYAVSNHFGSLGGGHYTAFALNELENTWYRFDDSSVSETQNPNSIVSDAAYVLFYRRKDTHNPDFHLHQSLQSETPTTNSDSTTTTTTTSTETNNNNNNNNNNTNNTNDTTSTTNNTTHENGSDQNTTTNGNNSVNGHSDI
ncbi:peptidase C19 family protein [Tieghemostelium lacteum]|uniref:ubiquitinyl hydrolase 1 n=1 Tax=Tieghemostelium lacteum TaxID=361077 RepID=A0A151ZGK2_TIELA|nr:peptidase C19 family protein [Tieghemostelium lacteum]|eukprot:KYQ93108.1 peptidase C19 family protein [Tieghemostelium lacteum]